MTYEKDAILHLSELIKGNDESRLWLIKNNFPELVLLHYSINKRDDALKELMKKNYVEVTAFAQSIRGNARAFNWLAENKKFILAATVQVIYKKREAGIWLKKNKLDHYLILAETIRKRLDEEESGDVFSILNKIFKRK
jgi:hypothetical protein